jgi:hypothetical protein
MQKLKYRKFLIPQCGLFVLCTYRTQTQLMKVLELFLFACCFTARECEACMVPHPMEEHTRAGWKGTQATGKYMDVKREKVTENLRKLRNYELRQLWKNERILVCLTHNKQFY